MKKIQKETIRLIVDNLDDVERFAGNKHIVVKNTVREHIQGIIELIKGLEITEELRDDLTIRALLHDAGELGGEISTITAVLNGDAPTKEQKDEFERLVFGVFVHYAMICVQDGTEDEFYRNLGALRTMVRRLADPPPEGEEKKYTLQTLIDWLSGAYEKMNKHGYAFHLEDLYKTAVENESYEGRLFKALDLLEGNRWYCEHAIDLTSTPPESLQGFLTYAREIISHLGCTAPETQVRAMLVETLADYENLVGGVANVA